MSDGHRSGRSTGRVSCKSTELKRCSMTEMHYYYYYYYYYTCTDNSDTVMKMLQLHFT